MYCELCGASFPLCAAPIWISYLEQYKCSGKQKYNSSALQYKITPQICYFTVIQAIQF